MTLDDLELDRGRPPFLRATAYILSRICHTNFVCLSVTRVYCIKTAERII